MGEKRKKIPGIFAGLILITSHEVIRINFESSSVFWSILFLIGPVWMILSREDRVDVGLLMVPKSSLHRE